MTTTMVRSRPIQNNGEATRLMVTLPSVDC
jgi:hypothetical protein